MTLKLSCFVFLRKLHIEMFSADPILLKSSLPLEKKQLLGSVLVFEQRTKQRQLNAQINNDSVWTYLCDLP